jgi:hypothetical protein
MVTKIADARHRNADVYLIELPEQHRKTARELTWRAGKIHAVRPVFRALGPAAALAYEAVERSRHSPTTAETARQGRLSRTTAEKALEEMAAYRMVHRDQDGLWHITATTSLAQLAHRLGADQEVAAQITLHRQQRAQWHAWLERHNPGQQLTEADLYDPETDEHWIPPDDAAIPAGLWRIAAA